MRDAVVTEEGAVAVDELFDRSRRASAAMLGVGVGDGDAVALLLKNQIEFFEAAFGAEAIGALAVPINWHLAPAEVEYVLGNCGAKILVVAEDLLPPIACRVPHGTAVRVVEAGAKARAAGAARTWTTTRPGERAVAWSSWLAAHEPLDRPPSSSRGAMIYTSGTTGRCRGVKRQPMTAAQATELRQEVNRRIFGIQRGVRALLAGPLYHSAPYAFSLSAVRARGVSVLMPRFDAESFLSLVQEHAIESVHMVPTAFVRLLQLPAEVRRRYDVSSLRHVVHTAAPCAPKVKRAMIEWWGPIIHEYYGSTETGPITFCTSADWLERPGTVGRTVGSAEFRILDPSGADLPPGEAGEVFVRQPMLPAFTYHGDEAGRRAIEREGFVSCGDVGYVDADGFLFLCDRKKDVVIVGGVNVYPAEVEAALLDMPAVVDCAVFGIPDAVHGERLAVAIQAVPGVVVTASDVTNHLVDRIARFKIPSHVIQRELPRDDAGKVAKRKLREPYWQGEGVGGLQARRTG